MSNKRMNKYIFIFICILIISCRQTEIQPSKVKLIWEDNFDNEILNLNYWNIYSGNGCPELCGFGNHELQYYTNDIKSINIKNGKLFISAYFDSLSKTFKSAKITSNGKVDFQTGYLEIDAQLPNAVGTWPAIWLLPSLNRSLNWPLDGEIDIMENVGYDSCKIFGTIHTKAYNHTNGTQKSDSIFILDAHQKFHTYALNWTDSVLEWYVDTILYNSIKRNSNDMEEQWPFDKKFHFIINQAVGGDWGGKYGIDTSKFPQKLVVDRVSLYNKKP